MILVHKIRTDISQAQVRVFEYRIIIINIYDKKAMPVMSRSRELDIYKYAIYVVKERRGGIRTTEITTRERKKAP